MRLEHDVGEAVLVEARDLSHERTVQADAYPVEDLPSRALGVKMSRELVLAGLDAPLAELPEHGAPSLVRSTFVGARAGFIQKNERRRNAFAAHARSRGR